MRVVYRSEKEPSGASSQTATTICARVKTSPASSDLSGDGNLVMASWIGTAEEIPKSDGLQELAESNASTPMCLFALVQWQSLTRVPCVYSDGLRSAIEDRQLTYAAAFSSAPTS